MIFPGRLPRDRPDKGKIMDWVETLRRDLPKYWRVADRLEYGEFPDTRTRYETEQVQWQCRTGLAAIARHLAEQAADPLLWEFALALEQPHYHGDDPARALWRKVEPLLLCLPGNSADDPQAAATTSDPPGNPPPGFVLLSTVLNDVEGKYKRAHKMIVEAKVPTYKSSPKSRRLYVNAAEWIKAVRRRQPDDETVEAFLEGVEQRRASIQKRPGRKAKRLGGK